MELNEAISKRRSIRAYKADPVADDKLEKVLRAARLAPSAANRQPWRIYVVKDEELRRRLKAAYPQRWFYEAPIILVICSIPSKAWSRRDGKNYADVDATIAFDHLILAAWEEGLGTCWIGAFDPQVVRSVLNLPPEEEPLAMTPLGYPEKVPNPTPRKALEDLVVFR